LHRSKILAINAMLIICFNFTFCTNIGYHDNEVVQNINLRGFDKESGKPNIDILLENLSNYSKDCGMADFELKDVYAVEFKLTEKDVFRDTLTVRYRLESNTKQVGYDAYICIIFAGTQKEAREMMRNSLFGYTALKIYLSDFEVGDVAIGDVYYLSFIRGNLFINMHGYNYEIDISGIAKEIDQQILEIITEKAV